MQTMNITEWSTLNTVDKELWLDAHSSEELKHILSVINEILDTTKDLELELSILPPNEAMTRATENTTTALLDMQSHIIAHVYRTRERSVGTV